jgi:hypothetical protein
MKNVAAKKKANGTTNETPKTADVLEDVLRGRWWGEMLPTPRAAGSIVAGARELRAMLLDAGASDVPERVWRTWLVAQATRAARATAPGVRDDRTPHEIRHENIAGLAAEGLEGLGELALLVSEMLQHADVDRETRDALQDAIGRVSSDLRMIRFEATRDDVAEVAS